MASPRRPTDKNDITQNGNLTLKLEITGDITPERLEDIQKAVQEIANTVVAKAHEKERVAEITTPGKRFARILGNGETATNVITEAVGAQHATPESIAEAILKASLKR